MSALAPPRDSRGFAVRLSDLGVRADVNYQRLAPTAADLVSRFKHPAVRLGDIIDNAKYGSSTRAEEEPVGPPVLRMVNLQDGDWNLDDLKYTTLDSVGRAGYLLLPGDICFNRTNSKELVGKCAVFRDDDAFRAEPEWIYASYLVRVRIADQDSYLPEFLARFLNSDMGRVQIDRLSRQIIGMANINAEEIKELRVPHPDPRVQQQMVSDLAKHDRTRRERLADIARLLSTGEAEIVERLGVEVPVTAPAPAWAATGAMLQSAGRINAEFFHPERLAVVRTIIEADTPHHRVDAVADFVKESQERVGSDDNYVGLANVERDTGELVETFDEDPPTGQVFKFRAGDVLFGKLRPYLNKVHLADESGVCSPEFFVLRPHDDVRAEYLAAILRSKLTTTQTRHMSGGNTHPRLTPADMHAMFIPVPEDPKVQDKVADQEASNRAEARKLKAQAEGDWSAAKQRFGDDLVA